MLFLATLFYFRFYIFIISVLYSIFTLHLHLFSVYFFLSFFSSIFSPFFKGSCIEELSRCLDDAPSRNVVITSKVYSYLNNCHSAETDHSSNQLENTIQSNGSIERIELPNLLNSLHQVDELSLNSLSSMDDTMTSNENSPKNSIKNSPTNDGVSNTNFKDVKDVNKNVKKNEKKKMNKIHDNATDSENEKKEKIMVHEEEKMKKKDKSGKKSPNVARRRSSYSKNNHAHSPNPSSQSELSGKASVTMIDAVIQDDEQEQPQVEDMEVIKKDSGNYLVTSLKLNQRRIITERHRLSQASKYDSMLLSQTACYVPRPVTQALMAGMWFYMYVYVDMYLYM